MSLPAIGDVVTVLYGNYLLGLGLYGQPGQIVTEPRGAEADSEYVLWRSQEKKPVHYQVRARGEGIFWMRGEGREIEAALLASYALYNCR